MDRVQEGFGFSRVERELTDLERELGNIAITADLPNGAKANAGWFVEAKIGGERYLGMIVGMTSDQGYVFKPYPGRNGASSFKNDIEIQQKNRWLNEAQILYGPLQEIRRADRGTLDSVAIGFDKVKHMGKYLVLEDGDESSQGAD